MREGGGGGGGGGGWGGEGVTWVDGAVGDSTTGESELTCADHNSRHVAGYYNNYNNSVYFVL